MKFRCVIIQFKASYCIALSWLQTLSAEIGITKMNLFLRNLHMNKNALGKIPPALYNLKRNDIHPAVAKLSSVSPTLLYRFKSRVNTPVLTNGCNVCQVLLQTGKEFYMSAL